MYEEFLSHKKTTASCDRNFEEWHLGIPHYGFWAVVIDNLNCLDLVSRAQTHLQHLFLPGYTRQAHITLNACGLLSETHFSQAKLDQQIRILEYLNLSPFDISLGSIESFSTAAYLSINSSCNTLQKLNKVLSEIVSDSSPITYTPHITLGLYRDSFDCQYVINEILNFGSFEKPSIQITEIQFCQYQTTSVQGPIEVVKRVKL